MLTQEIKCYFQLAVHERKCLHSSIVILLKVHVVLLSRGYKTALDYAKHLAASNRKCINHSPECIVLSVNRAARLVPGARCLSRSLAAYVLLKRAGYDAAMQIGVRKDSDRLQAHAWVEVDGVAFMEAGQIDDFHAFDDSSLR